MGTGGGVGQIEQGVFHITVELDVALLEDAVKQKVDHKRRRLRTELCGTPEQNVDGWDFSWIGSVWSCLLGSYLYKKHQIKVRTHPCRHPAEEHHLFPSVSVWGLVKQLKSIAPCWYLNKAFVEMWALALSKAEPKSRAPHPFKTTYRFALQTPKCVQILVNLLCSLSFLEPACFYNGVGIYKLTCEQMTAATSLHLFSELQPKRADLNE